MSGKPKIILTKNHKYQFQGLLRQFQNATITSPQSLNSQDVLQVLSNMGFMPINLTEHDYQLTSTITYMLAYPQGQGMVSQRNLFLFLVMLTQCTGNIDRYFQHIVPSMAKDNSYQQEPLVPINIGTFDEQGKWRLTKYDEQQIRVIFKQMVYTKAARQAEPKKEIVQEKHIPQILASSKVMARQRIRRTGSDWRVQDRLLNIKKIYQSRIQQKLQRSEEKEIEHCTFKPTITSFSITLDQQNTGNLHNRSQQLLLKGRQYDIKQKMRKLQKEARQQKMNQSFCSFHPDLSSSHTSLRSSIRRDRKMSVRNESKAIQRMKMGREERQYISGWKQRGYPAGKSWIKHLDQSRRTIEFNHCQEMPEQLPSITLNLQADGKSLKLEVTHGQNIEQFTNSLFENCSIPFHLKDSMLNLITTSINNSGQAKVRQGLLCISQ